MASVRQVQVTFDCANPERVARFWCEVVGYVVPPPPPGFDSWGDFVKNRVHLDVRVGTGLVGAERLAALEAERDRLIPLGATVFQVQLADGFNESCITMLDVEGNEFCPD
jgi:hypothetical protein